MIAGTGHRPNKLGGYGAEAREVLERFAERCVRKLQPDALLSGMAQGWDQALAQAAVTVGVPFDAYVPCNGQERRWPAEAQERYQRLLAQARSIRVVSPGPYAAWKMQHRNEAMVDAATVLLALWDGSDGGTGNCWAYALTQPLVKYNVWPQWVRWRHRREVG